MSIAGLGGGHVRVNQTPGNTSLDLSGGYWNIVHLVQGPDRRGDWHTLYHSGTTDDYQTIIDQGNRQLYSLWGGNQNSGYVMQPATPGWHMITTVGSPGLTQFYIDGVPVGSTTWSSTSDIWSIEQARGSDNQQQFASNLDDYYFYQQALTATPHDPLQGHYVWRRCRLKSRPST